LAGFWRRIRSSLRKQPMSMNTDPLIERQREIFLKALEKPTSAERAAYLDGACGNDAALRAEVELLLQHHTAGGFLESPAAGLAQTVHAESGPLERPGMMVGRYKLLQQVGEGGCGVVYMAEQEEPVRRRVALKVIKLGMDTKQVVARFEAERQALAMMDHPNIAKVFDAGATETGRPYFVMELVRGIKITEYCDQHNLSMRQRLDIFIPVCQAIQHAHQKGIIHRDIKPSNILVTLHDGVPVPKVIDFGIAKATEGRLTDQTLFTAFEQFIGTPAYMSPEQAELSGLDIDTRSDVYSLGVLLYELLTGRTPLDTKELLAAGLDELRRTIREIDPVRPSTRLRSLVEDEKTTTAKRRGVDVPKLIHLLSGDLDWIVMKCLEKDRTRRYETANGLAADIQRHLENEPVVARPPSRLYRFQKLVRRNKLAFAAVAAVTTALVLGMVASTWQFIGADRARRLAQANELLARANEQKALTAEQKETKQRQAAEERERELRQHRYVGDMNQAFHAIKEGNVRLATTLVANYLNPGPSQEDFRGWEWRYLWQLCQPSEHRTLANTGQAVNCAVFSPDGRLLAISSPDKTVRVLDVESGNTVTNLSGFDDKIASQAVGFSAHGRLLAAKGGHIVSIRKIETWEEIFRSTNEASQGTVVISPDGKTLATLMQISRAQKRIGFWDISSGQLLTNKIDLSGDMGTLMTYSPDGKLLALADIHKIQVHNARSLNLITNLEHEVLFGWKYAFRVESIAFSGNLMAAGYRLGEIKIWDTTTWAELASWQAHPSAVSGLDFSPDGKLLVSGGSDSRIQVWDLAAVLKPGRKAAPITPHLTLQGHTDKIGSVMFAPNGRRIVSCATDGTVRLWSLPSPDRPIPMFEAKPANDKLDLWFLEDGEHAVYCDQNWQFFLADISGATAPQPLKGPQGILEQESMAVSPDGKTLAFQKYIGGNGAADSPVQIWNLETGELMRTISPSRTAFAPGGILISSGGGEIRIEDLRSNRAEPVLTASMKADGDPMTLSADGRVLAARLSRTQIGFWTLPVGQPLGTIDVPRGGAETLALSYDGHQLAYCCWPENSPVLWDLTSRQSRTIPMNHVTSTWGNMAFAPDGKTLVLVDSEETAIFWNLATRREIIMQENLAGTPWNPKFSANGEYLALPLALWRAPSLEVIEAKERANAQDRLATAKEAGK
jgi:serine/threonine protein kinase/WD40 repeat protein